MITDLSHLCEVYNDLVDKDDEGIVQGFYLSIVDSVKNGTVEGDPTMKQDKLISLTHKKKQSYKFYS